MSCTAGTSAAISEIGKVASTVFSGLKVAAIWLGRVISKVYTSAIVPGVKFLWDNFLRTGFGLATVAGIVGWVLMEISGSDCLAGPENGVERRIVQVFAALLFVGAGVALTLGATGVI